MLFPSRAYSGKKQRLSKFHVNFFFSKSQNQEKNNFSRINGTFEFVSASDVVGQIFRNEFQHTNPLINWQIVQFSRNIFMLYEFIRLINLRFSE